MWLLLLALNAPAAADPGARSGHFALALSEEEAKARLDAAVSRSVQGFAFFLRPLAVRPLQRAATFCRVLETELRPTAWRVGCVEHGEERADVPLDGTPLVYDRQGVTITATLDARAPLAVRFATDDGYRITTYRFRDGGVDLDFLIASPRLQTPLTWTLPYNATVTPAPD